MNVFKNLGKSGLKPKRLNLREMVQAKFKMRTLEINMIQNKIKQKSSQTSKHKKSHVSGRKSRLMPSKKVKSTVNRMLRDIYKKDLKKGKIKKDILDLIHYRKKRVSSKKTKKPSSRIKEHRRFASNENNGENVAKARAFRNSSFSVKHKCKPGKSSKNDIPKKWDYDFLKRNKSEETLQPGKSFFITSPGLQESLDPTQSKLLSNMIKPTVRRNKSIRISKFHRTPNLQKKGLFSFDKLASFKKNFNGETRKMFKGKGRFLKNRFLKKSNTRIKFLNHFIEKIRLIMISKKLCVEEDGRPNLGRKIGSLRTDDGHFQLEGSQLVYFYPKTAKTSR